MRVKLNIKDSIEKNAAVYFEKAKKAKKRLEGVRTTIARYESELEKLRLQADQESESLVAKEKEEEIRKARPRAWYHAFRWFLTSDGFLVVGGRDATTNEAIIKKHAERGDLVFHTDMAGSPFFVIKSQGRPVSETAKKEAADATCTFSRAWKLGMPRQEVFCVAPDQVTKTAKSGEFLVKGAFVIAGKAEYIDNKIDLAIGVDEDGRVMAGPLAAVRAHCGVLLELEQGDKRASEIAKQIRHKLGGGDLDEIVRALPAGEFKFKAIGKKG